MIGKKSFGCFGEEYFINCPGVASGQYAKTGMSIFRQKIASTKAKKSKIVMNQKPFGKYF